VEIPDTAVWAATISVAGTVVAGVKITWTWLSQQFNLKDTIIAGKDSRIKFLEDELVKQARGCADEKATIVQTMSRVYVAKVDQAAELDRSILQANMASMSEFTAVVRELTHEVRGRGPEAPT
jgi:hypothetical protein